MHRSAEEKSYGKDETCRRLAVAFAIALVAGYAGAQDTKYKPQEQQIPSPVSDDAGRAWEGRYTPCNDATHRVWLDDLKYWRAERRIRIGYVQDEDFKRPTDQILLRKLNDDDVMSELFARALAVAEHQRERSLDHCFMSDLMRGFRVDCKVLLRSDRPLSGIG